MKTRPKQFLILATIALVAVVPDLFLSPTAAQQKPERDFGASLKQLKWDPAKKAAVEKGVTTAKGAELVDEGDVIRVESTLVVCDLLVADKQGRTIQGLTQEDFVIADDGEPQQVATFTLGDDPNKPRSIVLLIDYSGSQHPYLEKSIAAAKTLVNQLRPNDRMAIVTDDVWLLVGYTADKAKLKDALESLKDSADSGRYGLSQQYSALMATLRELMAGQERPIIIFQTDGDELGHLRSGQETSSGGTQLKEFSLVDLINAAERARVTIYTVIPNLRFVGLPTEEQLKRAKVFLSRDQPASFPVEFFNQFLNRQVRSQMALEGLSKLSGGWTEFLEKPEDAAGIYARILSDINHRYIVGFQPANKVRDGKRHRLNIEVRGHPEYIVWGRKFYYAPVK